MKYQLQNIFIGVLLGHATYTCTPEKIKIGNYCIVIIDKMINTTGIAKAVNICMKVNMLYATDGFFCHVM